MAPIQGIFPLYEIQEDGQVLHLGDLHPKDPKGFRLYSKHPNIHEAEYPDLPYFLTDMLPSGYLGRLVPKTHPELNLPDQIEKWTEEQCFAFWSFFGWNLVGNLIIGNRALNCYLDKRDAPSPPVSQPELNWHFPVLAKQVQEIGDEGGFACGEHPKFLIDYRQSRKSSLVKFSPPIQDPSSQRVADLLVAEHCIHRVLNRSGISAANSKIIRVKNQLFLEIDRFDRTDTGKIQGRKGIISFKALKIMVTASPPQERWSDLSGILLKTNRIPLAIHEKIQELEVFSSFIGSTSFPATHLSFTFENLKLGPLAPIYGLSPTYYVDPSVTQSVPLPPRPSSSSTRDLQVWNQSVKQALSFWNEVIAHPETSVSFQKIAQLNLDQLASQRT